MSHFSDYMDGVPVKISEKYKRPPRIELPYSITECPVRAQSVVDSAKYCSTFETNVLSKLKELRRAKETKKTERRHRLQLLEEAKQKKLDAIAVAEAEEKLKQLSVSEVSYPSTDEISALSSDERVEANCDVTPTQSSPETVEVAAQDCHIPTTSHAPDPQPNILQPIQVQSNYHQNNLLDDPDPLQEIKMSSKVTRTRIPHYNHNIETLTYKDFENDTSSPFDNVELKTINDMELLAQVLQSQRDSGTSCNPQMYGVDQTYATVPNCASQAQMEGVTYLPNAYVEQPIHGPGMIYSPEHYPVSNGYYMPENTCDNLNMYMPNYQYYVPANPYPAVDANYYSNQMPPTSDVSQVPNDSTYIPQPYYFHCPPVSMQYPSPNVTYNSTPNQNINQSPSSTSQHTMKSRSRSVPDIVKELDEELASAKLRANERSYNVSPAPKVVPETSGSKKREDRKSRKKSENLPNPYDKLPSKLQNMCQVIHGMGFPLDRVARVCSLLGDNDKKIIEGLLMIGELMDLGFSEGRVSAALAKHEFNKDKALDELVS